MAKVCLGDVANERKENCKTNEYNNHIVGLEHLISQEVTLTQWTENIENTFTKVFHKGDVLFGRRRAYLKKAAVAPFDGICSGDITVIEAKPNKIVPELLPFIIQNDNFFDYAVEKSAGSLSPRVKWSHLQNYEFELPDLNKQRELAELLWAAEEIKHLYQNLIKKSEILLEANFQKMLLEIPYKERSLDDLSSSWLKGQPFKKTEIVDEGENNCIHYGELFTTYGPIIDSTISKTNSEVKCASKVGDILFPASDVTPNGLARCSTIELKNVLLGGDIIIMRPKTSEINTKYLSYAINAQKEQLLSRVTGSLVRHISTKSLKSVIVPIPAQNIQDQFVDFAEKLEISKKSIVLALTNVKAVIKSIINQKITKEVSHV